MCGDRVPLGDEVCALVLAALEDAVRVCKPCDVGVRLQHIQAQLTGQRRDHVLAHVVKVEAHVPKLLDAAAAILRLGARDARGPDARELRQARSQSPT